MKIDRARVKRHGADLPGTTKKLIQELIASDGADFNKRMKNALSMTFVKADLANWTDLLDKFDEIFEKAVTKGDEKSWILAIDKSGSDELKKSVSLALSFTSSLFEHSFSRHIYASTDRLIALLDASDLSVVVSVLNLLYVIAKRSNFLTRIPNNQRQQLIERLNILAESWGGKENGFSLADCCQESTALPSTASTLHFEFYEDSTDSEKNEKLSVAVPSSVHSIHIENVDKMDKSAAEIMDDILAVFKVPKEKQLALFGHIRLAKSLNIYRQRLLCVDTRLLALSVLMYSGFLQEPSNQILYNGFIEECAEVLQIPDKDDSVLEIKTEVVKTLTAIIYLDRHPKLATIIEAMNANSYHGFLPTLVRSCVQSLFDGTSDSHPSKPAFCTALFSLLYHMAGYDNGAEALVSSGLTETLLNVITWHSSPLEAITFVTRSVRVIDLITNVDVQSFQALGGMRIFINRLAHEVDVCRVEQPYEIPVVVRQAVSIENPVEHMETDDAAPAAVSTSSSLELKEEPTTSAAVQAPAPVVDAPRTDVQCHVQRSALIKSLLNFIKKAIQDPQFAESVRHIMDGPLSILLRHIISNPEYYGASLFLLAANVVTVFIFQEPSQLSSLQDKGLTDTVMQALLVKDVPATREVLASLPNTFSALCLNERGLNAFVQCRPFEKLFKVLLSTKYLNAMRRRRSTDPLGDTAISLGTAIDELMRHQPTLKQPAMQAVIQLLQELCTLGSDPRNLCVSKWSSRSENAAQAPIADGSVAVADGPQPSNDTSDEEDDDDDGDSRQALDVVNDLPSGAESAENGNTPEETGKVVKTPVPLIDYIQNIMKFIEAILSNNATEDHARLFIQLNGLEPFMNLLVLPNLPLDFATTTAAQSLAGVARYVMTLTRDPRVLDQAIKQLNERVLSRIGDLTMGPQERTSVLINDLLKTPPPDEKAAIADAPLVRVLSELQNHLVVLSHLCRLSTNQGNELKAVFLLSWMERGGNALQTLNDVYRSLLWESTVMLTLCSESATQPVFAKEEIDALMERGRHLVIEPATTEANGQAASGTAEGGSSSSIASTEPQQQQQPQSLESSIAQLPAKLKPSPVVVKQLKPLISLSSRVARYLSDLFGSLLKMSIGSSGRARRGQAPYQMPPLAQGVALIESLMKNFRKAIEWKPPEGSNSKLWMAYLVCCISSVSQLLFDDRKQPYHLVLAKFYSTGAQQAFFKLFESVKAVLATNTEATAAKQAPDGFNEFLEAWLTLVEKLLNPSSVMESPYHLFEIAGAPTSINFSPAKYLAVTQKMTFDHVVVLWNELFEANNRVSELVLNILCHVVRAESVTQKELRKTKGNAEKKEPDEERMEMEQQVNPQHLQQLIDMGFQRELAIEALLNSPNVEQAAEFCVMVPGLRAQSLGGMVLDEEEQIQQAIALSLGNREEGSAPAPPATAATTTTTTAPAAPDTGPAVASEMAAESSSTSTSTSSSEAPEPPVSTKATETTPLVEPSTKTSKPVPLEEVQPSDPNMIREFFEREVLNCGMRLIDSSPDLVYRVADLLSVVIKSSSNTWVQDTIRCLCSEIITLSKSLANSIAQESITTEKLADQLTSSQFAKCLGVRLHLFCLLFEEFKSLLASAATSRDLGPVLVELLGKASIRMNENGFVNVATPKWISPLLLCLDLMECEITASKRRSQLAKMGDMVWKFWDNRVWSNFTPAVNKQLSDAHAAGHQTLRFTVNRRRYLVDFRTMTQVNQDSGFQRPVMMFPVIDPSVIANPDADKDQEKEKDKDKKSAVDTKIETTAVKVVTEQTVEALSPMRRDEYSVIIRSCVDLIAVPVDADTLHAALRLCLRLTRNYDLALEFLHLDGLRKLLRLRQSQAFTSLQTIVSLLVRHIFEDDATLRYNMEKIIRAVAQGAVATPDSPRNPQEYHYVMRLLGPTACRSPDLFLNVAQRVLRIRVPPPRRSDDDETNLVNPNVPIEVRVEGNMPISPPALSDSAKNVLTTLLNYLVQPLPSDSGPGSSGLLTTSATIGGTTILQQSKPSDAAAAIQAAEEKKAAEAQKKALQPLVLKSAVLRLLAELIRSYNGVAGFVTEYKYSSNMGGLVEEECSPLEFLLDHLLVDTASTGDSDCPAGVRAVVGTLAASNHCESAQIVLVTELKAALTRAANLPESLAKHQRICALVGLVTLVKDACPTVHMQMPTSGKTAAPVIPIRTNNIVKWLMRKKIVMDLARLVHHLDLAGPHTVNTLNAILKPLEELTRIINMPASSGLSPQKAGRAQRSDQNGADNRTTGSDPTTRNVGEWESDESSRLSAGANTMSAQSNGANDNPAAEQHVEPDAEAQNQLHDESLHSATVESLVNSFENAAAEGHVHDVVEHVHETSSESSSSSTEHTAGEDDDEDDDDAELDDDEVVGNQEDGNEAGSERDEEPSEYEDVDEEAAENEEHENMEEDDMSEFGDDFAMQQAPAGNDVDPLDVLNDVLREAMTRRETFAHDWGSAVFVTNRDGTGMNIPDVEQFLANAPEPLMAGSSSLGFLGATHPLLVRHADSPATAAVVDGGQGYLGTINVGVSGVAGGPRPVRFQVGHRQMPAGLIRQGAVRHRTYRYIVNAHPNGNSPAILQRLLGPNIANELIHIAQQLPGGQGSARFVISDETMRAAESGYFDESDFNGTSASGTMTGVPNAFLRFSDESRILDGDSLHSLTAVLRRDLLDDLVQHRQAEFTERKKKRELMAEEEKKQKEKADKERQEKEKEAKSKSNGDPGPSAGTQPASVPPDDRLSAGQSTSSGNEPTEPPQQDTGHNEEVWHSALSDLDGIDRTVPPQPAQPAAASEDQSVSAGETADSNAAAAASPATMASPVTDRESDTMQIEQDGHSNITNASNVTINSSESASPQQEHPATSPSEQAPPNVEGEAGPSTAAPEADGQRAAQLETYRTIFGDIELPEGVDPEFLAALPDNIRQEVIADQLRQQRLKQQNQQARAQPAAAGTAAPAVSQPGPSGVAPATATAPAPIPEVSPEFLAALPPELQEEVLAQQRLAQQQQQQQQQPPAADVAFDPGQFLEALPPSLRQQVLADADDSQLALLPPQLAAEARRLRSQMEHHQAARFAAMSRQFPFMSLLHRSRDSGGRYTIRRPPGARDGASGSMIYQHAAGAQASATAAAAAAAAATATRGQQLLDKETLASLLLLFFYDDQRFNVGRLHRIIKSLCCHPPTRDWIIRSLFSILEQTKQAVESTSSPPVAQAPKDSSSSSSTGSVGVVCDIRPSAQTWLNLTLNTALGNRADIFQVRRQTAPGKKSGLFAAPATVHIHPLAAPAVCRHVLDTLISLAKTFPSHFLPENLAKTVPAADATQPGEANTTDTPSKTQSSSSVVDDVASDKSDPLATDFWDVLLRLDSAAVNQWQKRPKQVAKPHSSSQLDMSHYRSIEESPLAYLLSTLRHPTVAQSASLTDRVLRLVALVANALPENAAKLAEEQKTATQAAEAKSGTGSRLGLQKQLRYLVEVVTRGQCSDEGLEDGRVILVQMVRCFATETREGLCELLFDASRSLGTQLRDQITRLVSEMAAMRKDTDAPSTSAGVQPLPAAKGIIADRYGEGAVVIQASGSTGRTVQSATAKELQLPSMVAFTQKNSTQQCLLRTLNTTTLLRETIRQQHQQLQQQKSQTAAETSAAAGGSATTTIAAPAAAATATIASTTAGPLDAIVPMEADEVKPPTPPSALEMSPLSQLLKLDDLWDELSVCLTRLREAADPHAVLVLQPAVEAFFLAHAAGRSQREAERRRRLTDAARPADAIEAPPSPAVVNERQLSGGLAPDTSVYSLSMMQDLNPDTRKLLRFAEDHRTVLNQILRQSSAHLTEGPFAVLVDYPRMLDFDVKRRYYRKELERLDEGIRRDDVAVRVRREHVFQESFRELFRLRPHEWKSRFYIIFEGEEGQDAGGLLREWYSIITRDIFNPNYALFMTSPGDRVTYMINPSSYINHEHLDYFKFVGRIIAKAVYDNKLLDCYFTRAFYKHILGKSVKYTDLESEDPDYYQSLVYLMENPVDQLGYELTFSLEVEEFGVREVRDLKPNGRNILVTDDNKEEYVRLVCQMKMTGAIRQQLTAFLEGFYDIIPKHLIAIFNEQELELLISGLPTIDIDDLQQNTDYHKYSKNSTQIQWFWRALRTFDQADLAKFLQFVTGTSKVPLQGFASLEGMHGVQKFQIHRDDRSTDRLPAAHTCFNQLDLPAYETYEKLRHMLLTAIRECSEGFGFA